MPVNADYEYTNAVKEYEKAQTDEERIKGLRKMLSVAPSHKSAQVLRADIKNKIAKLREKLEKQKKSAKKTSQVSIKKEGAATICLVGTENTGKSYFLNQLTGAKTITGLYKPQVGIYDYYGVKLQVIEIPPIKENLDKTDLGPSLLAIIRTSDLIVLFFNNPEEKNLLDRELEQAEINKPILIYNNQENIGDEIWKRLPLIKVQTKQPGKKPDYPPVALKKGSSVKNLAEHIHKDFIKKFKEKDKFSGKIIMPWARVWGKGVKFGGQRCGFNHILEDGDVVELHKK
ncbi:TGS domain-containing protein [Candidatus Woesearchaeota archaeon]|nr:TGS domain-containing protein [Candidatus Woesearchaeota archaeon]